MSSADDSDQMHTYNNLLLNYKESDLVGKIFKQDKKIKHRRNGKPYADLIGFENYQFLISTSHIDVFTICICILNS